MLGKVFVDSKADYDKFIANGPADWDKMAPAELGKINVKLTFDSEGKVQGTVTADNLSKAYGAALPALTYTETGLVNGDRR